MANVLRALDAPHLASALLLDVDVLLTDDDRLGAAAELNGVPTGAPGRSGGTGDAGARRY
ncbi:hypothetical protein B0I33_105209 [Prauserella shujinwangii]|uniref:PIN domain-containing protein n=1 Tax=Prauserella shujinwangii TaxID=1453103 RepID=A0A2T0LV31_9PSEU|nr:hypothetical protein [Prauserella shujinwangii]PRX47629.1 hypothetical protein B0I33_105209 [Prauserella shujinwangii]